MKTNTMTAPGRTTRRRYLETVWEIWSYDVWGNARDGYDVNDRSCQDREYHIRIPIETCNPGTSAAFDCASPTDRQIRAMFGIRCRFETDGDDTTIYVTRARDGYPIGELICMSHPSLSPIRPFSTYAVIVGNLGTVASESGPYAEHYAKRTAAEYIAQSKSGSGRAAGEAVTITCDGEPIEEYSPIEGCVFREMLLSDVPDLPDESLDHCQADLVLMARDEQYADHQLCYQEWIRRLGGVDNIPAYVTSLTIGRSNARRG